MYLCITTNYLIIAKCDLCAWIAASPWPHLIGVAMSAHLAYHAALDEPEQYLGHTA